MKLIIEKSLSVDKKVFCEFVYLEKAFDKVDGIKLWKILKEYGVNDWLLKVIKATYEGGKASITVSGQLSELFNIKQNVRQGCGMSSWLFNINMEKCLRMTLLDEKGVQCLSQNGEGAFYEASVFR